MAISPRLDAAQARAAHGAGIETSKVDPDAQMMRKDLLKALAARGLPRVYMVGGRASSAGSLWTRLSKDSLTTACRRLGGEEDAETLVAKAPLPPPTEATLQRRALGLDAQPPQILANYGLASY
ncbi:MAG: hypothetical protein ACYCTF_08350 [Acidiferrobacter sp.]